MPCRSDRLPILVFLTSLTQLVNYPPVMLETSVWFLGWEDPLEEGMAAHSSILAWRIPTDRGAWGAIVHGVAKSRTRLSDFHTSLHKRPAIWKNLNLSFPGYSWWGFQTCTSPLLSLILLDITENKIHFNTGQKSVLVCSIHFKSLLWKMSFEVSYDKYYNLLFYNLEISKNLRYEETENKE